MKKILLILGLFGSLAQAANPIISYVQISTGGTQAGGPNTQTATVKSSLSLPFIGSGIQCVRSVNGAISGTGVDCGAGGVVGGSNTIVASPQYQIPFYSASGSTNVLTGASGFSWYGSSATLPTLVATGGMISPNFTVFAGTNTGAVQNINGGIGMVSQQDIFLNPQPGNNIVIAQGANLAFVPSNGANRTMVNASTSAVTQLSFTLPASSGTSGQFLSTNGNGLTSWTTASGGGGGGGLGGTIVASPQFQVPYYSVTGTTTTVSGASGLTVNGAGNTLTASGGLATNTLTATGASSFTGAVSINPSATIASATNSQLTLNQTGIGTVEEGINFQQLGSSAGNYHQRNYSGTCSDLSTNCLLTPQSFDAGNGDLFFMNRDGRFDAMPTGSRFNAYSSVIGGSLIVGGTSGFNYTDTQNIGDGNLFVNHGTISSTATVNGPLNVTSTIIPPAYYSTIENPLVYISQQSAIGLNVGAQTDGLFVDFLDTGAVTNPLNDGVGIHGRSRQFQGSNGQLIAGLFDTQSQGANGPPSIAMQLVPGWVSDLAGGTNELIEGLVINPRIATITGGTLLSTGTAIGIRIPDFTNGKGAAGKNWPLYIDNPYPSYFLGSMGINQTDPQAPLSIASNGASQYALIVGTQTSGSTTMVSSQYLMTVSTQGAVTVNSLALNGTGNPSFTKNGDVNTYQIAGSSTVATAGQCAAWTSSDTLQGITCSSGGGGTPASPVGAIQYNSAGSFAAVSGSFVTASSVTLPITMVRSSMTIDNGSAAQDNSSPGFLDVFQQAPITGGILMSVGSSNQANQFVIQDQQPIKFQTNGIQAGFLNIGQSASEKISAGALSANQFINFDNSGEMDIQTASVGSGGKDIVMLPYQVETFRVSSASNTSAVPLLVSAAQGGLYLSNGQTGANSASGINLQTTPVSGANFAGGLLGYNLSWNVNSSSYIVSNDFGTDYFGMMVRRGGDVAFTGSNNTAANTFLTDAQVMANNKLYIKGTTGLLGVNMGATVPSTSGFQVQGSTTVPYLAYLSTTTTGGFGVDVSTTGHFNIFNSSATQGPTITNGTGDASCSDAACTITASNTPVTFTFAKPYTKVPVCVVTEQTDSVVNALSYSKTATALTITQTGLGGALLDVICVGRD